MAEQLVKMRDFATARQINAEESPSVRATREAVEVSSVDAGTFLKDWRAVCDSSVSEIPITTATIIELALRQTGTIWAEAVSTATAEHAIIENAWREEKAYNDPEITDLTADLDSASHAHTETVRDIQAQMAPNSRSTRDGEGSAAETHDQLALAEWRHTEEPSELKSQLAEAWGTFTSLQQIQSGLISRFQTLQKGGVPH